MMKTVTATSHCGKHTLDIVLKGSHIQRWVLEAVRELKLGLKKAPNEELQGLTEQ